MKLDRKDRLNRGAASWAHAVLQAVASYPREGAPPAADGSLESQCAGMIFPSTAPSMRGIVTRRTTSAHEDYISSIDEMYVLVPAEVSLSAELYVSQRRVLALVQKLASPAITGYQLHRQMWENSEAGDGLSDVADLQLAAWWRRVRMPAAAGGSTDDRK